MNPKHILSLFLISSSLLISLSSSSRPGPTDDAGPGSGFFTGDPGFTIPGFGSGFGGPGSGIPYGGGGGYGYGYGGPSGGYGKGGVVKPPTVVCKEKNGPCYGKKVTCPAKCFGSYSRAGKGYGGGGGGGGCVVDCKKKCVAYC